MNNNDLSYEVSRRPKPERVSHRTYPLPKDIVRPVDMEPVYTDGNCLYCIAPFSLGDELGRKMACVSFLYYAIACYDKDTGRFLGHGYAHIRYEEVQKKFNEMIPTLTLIDYPYHLYDLRITHGYLY